ncbi:MAG: O-antigen ligase family protein [Acidobacteria bacterium]|nr:O-antigen ligase family protein [Acidobacteriota bacterium]
MNAAALALLLAWTLFAFGGVYTWTFLPALIASAIGALFAFSRRSAWPAPSGTRLLDAALAGVLAAAAFQLVPLPGSVRALLSPAAADYFSRSRLLPSPADGWAPLSLVPDAWLFGAGVALAAALTFWWARTTLESRGVRALVRWLAWIALAVSVIALVQPALFPSGKIYGLWTPTSRGAHPIGPIVSRNHFAGWVVLVWPLLVGYLIAHGRSHWRDVPKRRVAVVLMDTRALWLVVAIALLTASLLITESRAGVVSFGLAALVLLARSWSRTRAGGRLGLAGLLIAIALAVSLWASPAAVMNRFDRAWSGADGGRPEIWRETRRLIAQFPLTGIGLGAFDVVMPVYQQAAHTTLVNHAHNQYLHILAEGGLLVSVPAAITLLAFVGLARRRLRDDGTAMAHVRDGAVAGLCGLALLSVFDVPALTPAVVLTAVIAAAIAVHRDDPAGDPAPAGDGDGDGDL